MKRLQRPPGWRWLAASMAAALLATACGGTTTATTVAAATTQAPGTTVALTTVPPTTTLARTTMAPTTTAAATTTTTTAPQELEARDLEEVIGGEFMVSGWLVEPGLYTANRLEAAPLISIEQPVAFVDFPGTTTFGRRNVSDQQYDIVVLFEAVGVTPADAIGIHPEHDPVIPANTQPIPDSLDTWLEAAKQIEVVETGEIEVAGAMARFWDVKVDPSAGDTYFCGRPDCVAFMVGKLGPFAIWDDARFRVWQLSGDGEGVWAWMQSGIGQYDDTLALAHDLLAGMSFGTG